MVRILGKARYQGSSAEPGDGSRASVVAGIGLWPAANWKGQKFRGNRDSPPVQRISICKDSARQQVHDSMANRKSGRVRQNTRFSILNGSFSIVATGTVATYLPLYLLDGLHASDQAVALANALPALLGAVAIGLGALILPKLNRYQPMTVVATLLARLVYAMLGFTPFFAGAAVSITIYAYAGSSFMQGLAGLGWQALIDRLIPSRLRAGFFSQRNVITTAVGLTSTLILGVVLSHFSPHAIGPYRTAFALASAAGIGEAYYLARHQEPEQASPFVETKDVVWQAVFQNRPFLTFILASAFFNIGWQAAWPLYSIYQIRMAHATSIWIGLFTLAGQMGQILSFRWWGRYSVRHGNLIPLAAASLGLALNPVLTIASRSLPWLILVNLLGGLTTSGIILLLFNQLLAQSPKKRRPSFIAAYNIVLGLVGFLAPELGVILLDWIHMTAVMILLALWRVAAAAVFLRGTGTFTRLRAGGARQVLYGIRRRWIH